ncbi:MAG: ABC transporter permease subunit, partial [Actinomycetota bacterium]
MIAVLLWLLAIALVGGVIYVIGRLAFDIWELFTERASHAGTGELPPLGRDVKALGLAAQLAALAAIVAVILFLGSNFVTRANDIGLDLSFGFLDQPGNISIADNPLQPANTVEQAITAGFLNTIRIILVGIPLALILGTLIGISRLSSNWLLRKLATGYVEFFRNIPPLVVIIFVWRVVFLEGFPRAEESWRPLGGWFIFNNARFSIPSVKGLDNFVTYRWILLAALLITAGVAVWRTRVFNETGRPHHRVLWGIGTFGVISVAAFVALGGPAELSKPMLDEAGER